MVHGSHFLDTLWVSHEYEILLLCTIFKDPKSSNSKRFDLGYPAVSWNLKPYAKFHDVLTDHSLTFALQTDLKSRKHESWSFPRGLLSKQSYLLHTPGFPSYLTAVSSNAVCLEWISGRGGVMATAWDTECENLNQKVPSVHTQQQTVTYLPYSLK